MERDPSMILLGEDVGAKGGVFNGNVTKVGAEEVRPEDGEKSQAAVYLLDDKRAGQQR